MLEKWFKQIILKDFILVIKRNNSLYIPIIFFTLIILLFPFSLGSHISKIQSIGIHIIIISILLTSFLSLNNFLQEDYIDGSLELLLFSPISLEYYIFIKNIIHWLLYKSLIICLIPLLGNILGLSITSVLQTLPLLIILTIIVTFIGTVISIITLSLEQKYFLTILIIFPTILPTTLIIVQLHEELGNIIYTNDECTIYTVINYLFTKKTIIILCIYCIITCSLTPWIGGIVLSIYFL